MSERGTFITNFLYDGNLVSVLQKTLPELSHSVYEHMGRVMDVKRPVWFAGQIKGSFAGEEAILAHLWVDEILIPALPTKHGQLTIMVLPDNQKESIIIIIKNKSLDDVVICGCDNKGAIEGVCVCAGSCYCHGENNDVDIPMVNGKDEPLPKPTGTADPTPDVVIEWMQKELSFSEQSRRCGVFNKTWADPASLASFFRRCSQTADDTLRLFVRAAIYVDDHRQEYDT